jgi:hypothetical protein
MEVSANPSEMSGCLVAQDVDVVTLDSQICADKQNATTSILHA